MELIITSKEDILKEAYKIQDYLDMTMSENPEEAVQRGNDLAAYLARTTKMLADAKYHLNTSTKTDIFNILKEAAKQAGATPSAVNRLVKSASKEEQYLVDLIERLNAACVHQIDWCRTLISKAKAEMQYTSVGRF